MTVTFVTAFLDLRETRNKSKTTETRFQLFNQLNATGIRLHVFVSPEYRNNINVTNGVIQTISLEDLDMYAMSPQGLPNIRAEEHDTRNFLILMNAKIEFMKRAIESGLHSSTHYAWTDFNLYHVLKDPESARELRAIETSYLPPRCLFFPGCWEKKVVWDTVNWRFCGGFFLGDTHSLLDLYKTYVQEYPRMPKLTWEVNTWAYLESLGTHFDWYRADHKPSIVCIPRNVVSIPADIQYTWASYDQRLMIHGPIYQYVLECIRPTRCTAVFPKSDGIVEDSEYNRMMISLGRIETVVTPSREYSNFEACAENPIVCVYATWNFRSPTMLLMPWDDVAFENGLSFPQHAWSDKISTVMWRGGSSGFHRPSTRMRVVERLFGVPNTDVKFVPGGWPYNDNCIPPEHFADKSLLGPEAHSRYKYVMIIDGNTQASNGQWGFAIGSVPIIVTYPGSRWWFRSELRHMVNCMFVEYDLSDLISKIEWLVAHDEEARIIAENALEMSKRVFSPSFQRGYINNRVRQIAELNR